MYSHRTIGEIIRVNLAQDGPAPAFFNEWCYNFICTGAVDLSRICKEDVADQESLLLINRVNLSSTVRYALGLPPLASLGSLNIQHFQVENVSDTEFLMLLAENIVNCGYTAQNKLDNKESIIR